MKPLRNMAKAFAATPLAWGFVAPIAIVAVLWFVASRRLAPNPGWLIGSVAWSLAVVWLSLAPLARLGAHPLTLAQFVALVIAIAIEGGIASKVATHDVWLWHVLFLALAAIPALLTVTSCERCKRVFALRGLAFKGERRTTHSVDADGKPYAIVVEEGTSVAACAYCGAAFERLIKRELPLALVIPLVLVLWPYLVWRSSRARLVPRS